MRIHNVKVLCDVCKRELPSDRHKYKVVVLSERCNEWGSSEHMLRELSLDICDDCLDRATNLKVDGYMFGEEHYSFRDDGSQGGEEKNGNEA